MYKVVIIDDEPIIVEGLSRSIQWKNWQCEVVGTASSGEEGMELIDTVNPDILFSDICMPGMDGLTMIAAIKSQHPNMEITILTGFRDFDYAQRAIRLGVTRFLLKPSKTDELMEAVEKMTNNLAASHIYPDSRPVIADTPELTVKGENFPADQEDVIEDSPAGSFIVNNALQYMEENYMNKLKLSDVAEKCFVSQWHLSKLLNRYKEQSFSDILNNIRVEKAKAMLQNPTLRIGDVAEHVGFMDMAHFSRVFKKRVGVSANEYRNTVITTEKKS